jgi:RNA polymerase sigma-70 factor (sigma-E family)
VGTCEDFVTGQQPALLRAAYLLTGSSPAAQDLVQETLVRVLVQWRRVERADAPEAYARRIMLNVFLGGRRRAWVGELPHGELPETATASAYDGVDARDALRRALLAMPARQRAAVVLRHYEDRTEAETAALMGCSVGNVKALTSRGLVALRAALLAGDASAAAPRRTP